jgi:hypothetical protein
LQFGSGCFLLRCSVIQRLVEIIVTGCGNFGQQVGCGLTHGRGFR